MSKIDIFNFVYDDISNAVKEGKDPEQYMERLTNDLNERMRSNFISEYEYQETLLAIITYRNDMEVAA